MSVRLKIFIGIAFMMIQITTIGMFSIYHAHKLSEIGKSAFVENSRSIEYCENIIRAFESINHMNGISYNHTHVQSLLDEIELNIKNEELNITELGEKELVASVKNKFASIRHHENINKNEPAIIIRDIILDVHKISNINIKAIERKNCEINTYENTFYVNVSILASILMIISIVMLFNFPEYAVIPNIKFHTSHATDINDDINKNRCS